MKNAQLKIEYISVNGLKPYERNVKKHVDFDVENIAKSIQKYGFDDPIGIWGKDNTVVEGHGRLLAAKKLGLEKVPCIRLDHLTDKERREYAIAHNKTAELSLWNDANLSLELPDLDFEGFDFGFKKVEKEILDEEKEVEFSEILGEENNYIILKFVTDIDWINAQTVFNLKTVKSYSTRKDGKITDKMCRKGIGRVLDGAKVVNMLVGGGYID